MAVVRPDLSIISFSDNWPNSQSKRQRATKWVLKQGPTPHYLEVTYFPYGDAQEWEVKGRKKIAPMERTHRKAGEDTSLSHKIDFKSKAVKGDIKVIIWL